MVFHLLTPEGVGWEDERPLERGWDAANFGRTAGFGPGSRRLLSETADQHFLFAFKSHAKAMFTLNALMFEAVMYFNFLP